MGIDKDLPRALYKALLAAGLYLPPAGNILATVADKDKETAIQLLKSLAGLGFLLYATDGTARALEKAGCKPIRVNKIVEGSPHVVDYIREAKIDVVINTLTKGKEPLSDGFRIRRAAVELNIPCLTSLDTVKSIVEVIQELKKGSQVNTLSIQEYLNIKNTA